MMGKLFSGRLARQNVTDAGQDVYANETVLIPARSSALISTGLVIGIPKGHVGLLWSRSGLSVKYNLEVGAGCIDAGYRGEVKVHLYNHSDYDYTVNEGDRIAQLLTIPINTMPYTPTSIQDETDRGDGGFGSTGK